MLKDLTPKKWWTYEKTMERYYREQAIELDRIDYIPWDKGYEVFIIDGYGIYRIISVYEKKIENFFITYTSALILEKRLEELSQFSFIILSI